jgi:hypothetical protein
VLPLSLQRHTFLPFFVLTILVVEQLLTWGFLAPRLTVDPFGRPRLPVLNPPDFLAALTASSSQISTS